MRDRESIVHIDVAEARQRGDEIGIVRRFAVVEAGVLQAENVAGPHDGHGLLGDLADAVLGKGDRPADDARGGGGDRLERVLGIALFRAAEMREQDHFPAFVGDLRDGRRHRLDAGYVRHLAVLHRHVEVDAHEHAFAVDVGVVEGAEGFHERANNENGLKEPNQESLPIATAVSIMRLEKPHSLSYHAITRTRVPSITLVWSM